MSCNCTKASAGLAPEQDLQRTAAVMCLTCREWEGRCDRLPNQIPMQIVIERRCPKGRHPDKYGIVRWFGVRWRGVPAIISLLRPLGIKKPPNCGCIDRVKTFAERFEREPVFADWAPVET